jgi:hypothetical protein
VHAAHQAASGMHVGTGAGAGVSAGIFQTKVLQTKVLQTKVFQTKVFQTKVFQTPVPSSRLHCINTDSSADAQRVPFTSKSTRRSGAKQAMSLTLALLPLQSAALVNGVDSPLPVAVTLPASILPLLVR